MMWGLFTHVQLPFYIASSKAPHRVSRVAEKQLVRGLADAMLIFVVV